VCALGEVLHYHGFVVGRVIEAPLRVYLWATRVWRQSVWVAFCPRGELVGYFKSRNEARLALGERFREARADVGQIWRRDPSRLLVDPDASAKPSIGRHYERWSTSGESRKSESLSAFERLSGQIGAWRTLSADEERDLLERYKATGHPHPRLLRPALIAAKAAAKKWPDAHVEDLFAVTAAAMPAVLAKFDPTHSRLSTFANRPLDWAITDCLVALGILHPRGDPNAWLKAQVLRPLELVAPAVGAAADDGDDDADSDYSAGEADLAWKAAMFDADFLGTVTELLASLEGGIERRMVSALLGGDLTQKEVAAQLPVSEATVSRARASAYVKLCSLAGVPATRAKYAPLGVSEEDLLEEAETRTRGRTPAMPR
jgi:DNA-directed RNA polymerase specialized sigma subunit